MLPAHRSTSGAAADSSHLLASRSGFGVADPQAVGIKNEAHTSLHSPSASTGSLAKSIRPTSTGSQFAGTKRVHDGYDDSDSPDLLGDGSPTEAGWGGQGQESRIGVKRACNECRQQKLKCNVQQDPFRPCDRCQKQKIPCRIDANFKRVGKRKKNAEMEQENNTLHQQLSNKDTEIAMLRQQLMASPGSQQVGGASHHLAVPMNGDLKYPVPRRKSAVRDMVEVGDAVGTMMDLRNLGSPGPNNQRVYNLDGFSITADRVEEFFTVFFTYYHPFLPLMNKTRGPSFYHQECPLLFWVIMATAMRKHNPDLGYLDRLDEPLRKMLWATISDVKQHYLVVKALATIITWPLPVSYSNADPTPMLCGIMVQLAKQIGLHRPTHAQDFDRFTVDLRFDELRDRYYTWAACNIVAQRVSTGYGLPANTLYDWTLTSGEGKELSFSLPEDVKTRLRIEMFSSRVSSTLYGWDQDPLGIASPDHKQQVISSLDDEARRLEIEVGLANTVNRLYYLAARVHYHIAVLFDPPGSVTSTGYRKDLDKLYRCTCDFIQAAINISSPHSMTGPILVYGTNYIFQMLLASGFVVLKLLNSFYAQSIDREQGRQLFSAVVDNVRSMGVMNNDLPCRLAEVLAQLWQKSGRGDMPVSEEIDDSLRLKVGSRMSMSIIHDSVWRWKELFHLETNAEARDAALSKTTDPNLAPLDQSLAPPSLSLGGGNSTLAPPASISMRRSPTPVGADRGWGDIFSNDVFDPTAWLLNGQLTEFPVDFSTDPFGPMGGMGGL